MKTHRPAVVRGSLVKINGLNRCTIPMLRLFLGTNESGLGPVFHIYDHFREFLVILKR